MLPLRCELVSKAERTTTKNHCAPERKVHYIKARQIKVFLVSRRVSVPVRRYSTMATPGTPPRKTRWNLATSPVTPATPPRSPAIVKGGELSEESRMEMALPIAVIMHPGETRLRSGVSSAITTEYGVGESHTSQLWQNIAQQLMDGSNVGLR